MSKRSVFIVGGGYSYADMFKKQGWKVTDSIKLADLIQFTGGEDVNPAYYGEVPHPTTGFNPERDKREAVIFAYALEHKIPMAGICRGGQFLNVMCGGRLWQHVTQHARMGTHEVVDTVSKEKFQVTSTHHQMMRPSDDGFVVLTASMGGSRTSMLPNGKEYTEMGGYNADIEAVYYDKQRCFCFQPHPEFNGHTELRKRYFQYLETYLFSDSGTC